MALEMTVRPTGQVISPADVAAHLRIDAADIEAAQMERYIRAATAEAEAFTNRQILEATYRLTIDAFPDVFEVPRPPLRTVTSLTYLDAAGATKTLTETTDFVLDIRSTPGRIVPAYTKSWPTTYDFVNAVILVYTAGYNLADVPDAIVEFVYRSVGWLYENREATAIPAGYYHLIGHLRVHPITRLTL